MSRLRVGDLGDSTHSRPEDHGHAEFDVILGMDWLTAYRVVIDCERMRVTAIRRMVLLWYFKGTVYESRCHGQLAGWLASLTLEDEERPGLDLPQVI